MLRGRNVGWLILLSVTASCVALACGAEEEAPSEAPASQEPPAVETDDAPAEPPAEIERARRASKGLGKALKMRLTHAMAEGGPQAAIAACADEAQAITASANESEGVRVGRTSSKLRNPENTSPAWVREWLDAQDAHPATAPTPLARMEGSTAHFAAPILVDGVCLTCHGEPESIPPAVRAVIEERYPDDEATGYHQGDLRGAIWAEVDR